VDLSEVTIVPGFYKDSLTEDVKTHHRLTAASIVMVDCDLYSSTKCVLEFITSLVVNGSIIIFDDWFAFKGNPNLGEQLACREWLEANPGLTLSPFARYGLTQQAFIVHKEEAE
jgi:O-methyltransferase